MKVFQQTGNSNGMDDFRHWKRILARMGDCKLLRFKILKP